jgi:hypothetical protein
MPWADCSGLSRTVASHTVTAKPAGNTTTNTTTSTIAATIVSTTTTTTTPACALRCE